MHWRTPSGIPPPRFPKEKSFALFGVDPYIEVSLISIG